MVANTLLNAVYGRGDQVLGLAGHVNVGHDEQVGETLLVPKDIYVLHPDIDSFLLQGKLRPTEGDVRGVTVGRPDRGYWLEPHVVISHR